MHQKHDTHILHLQSLFSRRSTLAWLSAGLLAGCAGAPQGGHSAASSRERAAAMRRRMDLDWSGAGPQSAAPWAMADAQREAVVARTILLVNTPYKWGGNTPESGFDCSGLIFYVFNQVLGEGRAWPRSTAQWAKASQPVRDAQMQRGDLVFFNTSGRPWSHMGLYIGERQFVHAPSSGGKVRKASLDNRYFAKRYLGARTVLPA